MPHDIQVARGQENGTAPMQDTEGHLISEICLVTVAQLTNALAVHATPSEYMLLQCYQWFRMTCRNTVLLLTHLLLPAPAAPSSASSTSPLAPRHTPALATITHAAHRCMAYHSICIWLQLNCTACY